MPKNETVFLLNSQNKIYKYSLYRVNIPYKKGQAEA